MVNVAGGTITFERILRYRYRCDVTSEAMMKRSRPARCTTRNFPPREIRTWNSFALADIRRAVFNRLASINHRNSRFSSLFFSTVIDASPFRRSPFCCVSRPPSTLPRPLSIPSHSLRKCMVTNKNDAVSAQRISMLFLSYRRATNERAVCSSSAPFFFKPLCFTHGTDIARMHVADDVISDCRVSSR